MKFSDFGELDVLQRRHVEIVANIKALEAEDFSMRLRGVELSHIVRKSVVPALRGYYAEQLRQVSNAIRALGVEID